MSKEIDTDVCFENERYMVYPTYFPEDIVVENHGATYLAGYAVENKTTDIVEVYTPQLPDAIGTAEQLDMAMEQQPWAWMRIQAEADSAQEEPDEEVPH